MTAIALYQNDGKKFTGSYNFGPKITNNVSVERLVEKGYEIWGKEKKTNKSKHKHLTDFKECKLLFLNCDKAYHFLGWSPILNFEKTLAFTINWYKEYISNPSSVETITGNQIKNFEEIILKLND